ncbi:MAG: hypothetical protein DRI44_08365 [Chlamydiae bacterium]|nr:MAG: hypothetical protein DRI44_08365 [Chlamydiota bacterium]
MSLRVAVIGAGLAGLTANKILEKQGYEVIVLEKHSHPGGLCYSIEIDGVPIDIAGGHIFNATDSSVREFVFGFTSREEWNYLSRNAKILIEDIAMNYPFEYNVAAFFPEFFDLFISQVDKPKFINLADFFRSSFGEWAYEKYFRPYNEKIWQYNLHLISTCWMDKTKIPLTTKDIKNELIKKNEQRVEQNMTHSTFYYPKNGGIYHVLVKPLLKDANVKYDVIIERIRKHGKSIFIKTNVGIFDVDMVVNTAPLSDLLQWLSYRHNLILPHHGTDVLLVKSDFFTREENSDISWMYFPERKYWWHRFDNLSYFQQRAHEYMLIEAPLGAYHGQKVELGKFKFEIVKVFRHVMTYPINDITDEANGRKSIISELRDNSIICCGRWGAWEYLNMDKVIKNVFVEVSNGEQDMDI